MGLAYVQLSVLIDTYNHERLIAKAISSVLEQDYPESQRDVIVVDDGSTDHSAEIVRSFAQQVRLITKQKRRAGVGVQYGDSSVPRRSDCFPGWRRLVGAEKTPKNGGSCPRGFSAGDDRSCVY
jgi:cellulose synthase/poly-beta-1,6-N-acetylglucosamine synthase-like glycosyltransferase